MIVGLRQGDAIVVRGLDPKSCLGVVSLQSAVELHSANFAATEDGVIFTTEPPFREGGLLRIDGPGGIIAIVVINHEQALRDATRPKAAAKLLDHLGRLDSYDGFDEIFDLLQGTSSTSPILQGRSAHPRSSPLPQMILPLSLHRAAAPFGPRGVSLATIQKPGHQNHLLENGLVSEVIAALIRAMGPVSKPVLDGDGRNVDADDARPDELSADDVAQSQEADLDLIRRRLAQAGHGLSKAYRRDDQPAQGEGGGAYSWTRAGSLALQSSSAGTLLATAAQATLPPASSVALDGHRRPAGLVGVNQLREAFKVAMRGMYGERGIARLLETSPAHRASDDRAMLDDVLLWTAHEIGADYEEKAVFNEQPAEKSRRLGDRADVVVVAISAAAHPYALEVGVLNQPSSRIWEDAKTPSPDWVERHRRLGAALQSGSFRETPTDIEPQTQGRRVCFLGGRTGPSSPRSIIVR